jgi:rhodanese-related sulfurtransferase
MSMRHTKQLTFMGAIATILALSACGGGDSVDEPVIAAEEPAAVEEPADGPSVDYGLVTPQQAVELAQDDDVIVIDVRTPEEFAQGHLEGAELIDFNGADFDAQIAELDPDQQYLVYCRSDNRSGQAVAAMAAIGVDRVWDMDGGIVAYQAAGLPIVT